MEKRITDDLDILQQLLPNHIAYAIDEQGNTDDLLEIVMDLGRLPTARYVSGEVVLSDREITRQDLDMMTRRIGHFDADNRAGLERTLHRISAIRNRRGEIVGLTCRIGRAVYGTIDIIEELIKSGKNLLMLGSPGVGKTTMLREAARVLAEEKRVVIVDTSNEIGGDGDVPHPAVGRARRMQVPRPDLQHEVMIEAVENHNPQVIVIDEIGREQEAAAARTIAERGVQLIGTAHGNSLENLLLNPTLSDLVGGIESVTLSDEEARRRGTQKTVLERRAPPTFQILVELQDRHTLIVHEDVGVDVDFMLRGKPVMVTVRQRHPDGRITREVRVVEADSRISKSDAPALAGLTRERDVREVKDKPDARAERRNGSKAIANSRQSSSPSSLPRRVNAESADVDALEALVGEDDDSNFSETNPYASVQAGLPSMHVYAYGVARNRLLQAARRFRVPLDVVDDLSQANAIVTLKTYYRNRPKQIADAERHGTPIYVLRANTVSQIENFLIDVFKLERSLSDPMTLAMMEAERAIQRIQEGLDEMVALTPQAPHIRQEQHRLARSAHLYSKSFGEDPHRHVRIYGEEAS
ncbi:MAG: AAA family ATPase [Anaerolineae bacterium]|nr:AAA family ATPase [Anaerolineae bacterium]MDW8172985.1 R3H domain-containing nucleic acid-binding protein [Anaerolineae bacterium]